MTGVSYRNGGAWWDGAEREALGFTVQHSSSWVYEGLHHGEIILDPFAGTGPVVIAAERTGRIGYANELSPKYIAVILQRCREMGLEPALEE